MPFQSLLRQAKVVSIMPPFKNYAFLYSIVLGKKTSACTLKYAHLSGCRCPHIKDQIVFHRAHPINKYKLELLLQKSCNRELIV